MPPQLLLLWLIANRNKNTKATKMAASASAEL